MRQEKNMFVVSNFKGLKALLSNNTNEVDENEIISDHELALRKAQLAGYFFFLLLLLSLLIISFPFDIPVSFQFSFLKPNWILKTKNDNEQIYEVHTSTKDVST